MPPTPAAAGVGGIGTQAARRRTFAIVSHPDAGKTTTTEKLLLYAGALDRAGSVKARSGQSQTTSDWMEFERRRGISITATALQFPHEGLEMTLLDTPGHHDFSEDTLRVMSAADCAVVLLDASRGIERQTARLLEVARERRMPLLVFVNKCDRPGLEPLGLLEAIAELTPPPRPARDAEGVERPLAAPFAGFVFKVQANMDPRHRDNLAYLRICSGRFERGMRVTNARSGRELALNYPQQIFGRERSTLDEAWPGDVIGVVNAADLRVGDTVYGGDPVRFPPPPRLDPSRFAVARNALGERHKQFERGLRQLDGEGLIQVLRRDPDHPESVLAGIGELQFEAVAERMRAEFGVELRLEPLPFKLSRRADRELARALRAWPTAEALFRSDGEMLAAFRDEFDLGRFVEREGKLTAVT